MNINRVDRYSFVEANTVEKITPVNVSIDKKKLNVIIYKVIKRIIDIIGGLVD